MDRRAGNVLVLMMGIVLISSSRADVLNYAREWTSRNDENKAITSPSQPQAEEDKSSAPRQNLLYSDRCPVRNLKLRLRRQQEKEYHRLLPPISE